MSQRKVNQLIWLDAKTMANIMQLYVRSGASELMAVNEFIAKILMIVTNDNEMVRKIIERLYSTVPELKSYSYFIERVEVEKPVERIKFVCPFTSCDATFNDKRSLVEHLRQVHKVTISFNG